MRALEKQRIRKGFQILKKMGRLDTMMNQKALYPELYDLSVGYLFGEIWTRPHLTLRERQLITLAANIALARLAVLAGLLAVWELWASRGNPLLYVPP